MKLNPITKNPEIMRGVFEIEDGKFVHDNPYGYITNLKDTEIHAKYMEFKRALNEKTALSDEERFFFDMLMIERFRPELRQHVM